MLTEDMRAVIAAQRLCFAATVTPDGRPNLSPKGTIRVWDDRHLFFLDIASPQTRRNLERNPWIELNVIDPLSRRGYRFMGRATVHSTGEAYDRAVEQIAREEGTRYHAETVVLIQVQRALSVYSPGYDHIPTEAEMRTLWKERRQELDREFEEHLVRNGGFTPPR